MTPAARIKATIEIFEKSHNSRVPLDSVVGDYMRHRRYIGSKDRADIAQRTYNMIRAYAKINWWLEKTETKDTPRNRVLAWLALEEKRKFSDLFDGSKYGPEKLTDEEKLLTGKLERQPLTHTTMPDAVRVECPSLYEDKLRDYFGDDFLAEIEAMIPPATLDLRVNMWRCDKQKAKESLQNDNVETNDTPYCPWGLRTQNKVFLSRTKAWSKGWVEIQDEGSQLIAHICNAQPGMQVLDYCAGGGGKTLALASAMQNKGRIVAMDLDAKRLEKSRQRIKKAGVADMIEVRPLSDEKNRKWLRRQKSTFDLVLTDVPCTGTGTWRRNPDMRWRTLGPSLEELINTQAEILDKVAKAVKVGGHLVYATCSLLPDENEQQIENFLKRHDNFIAEPLDASLKLGSPYMRLTPYRHNTDGFFAAIMTKTKD